MAVVVEIVFVHRKIPIAAVRKKIPSSCIEKRNIELIR
jgi:hypothetical protein